MQKMFNDETILKTIQSETNIKAKQDLILEYIKSLRCNATRKQKLSIEVRQMNSVSKLDYFIFNLFLVGDGQKVI